MSCTYDGSIKIFADPKPVARYMWQAKPINIQLQVPGHINSESATAFLTMHGQFYLKVESVP